MPVWMIPLLMSMAGGAAGQAKGHNTKSTLEGAGMGALLGLGGAGLAGGAAGGAADAGADAATAGSDALGSAVTSGAASAGAAGMDGGALDLASLTSAEQGGMDAADASVLGSGAQQGVTAADMGAMSNVLAPGANVTPTTSPSMWSQFASNPTVQKGFGKADDMGWNAAAQAALTPNRTMTQPGQGMNLQQPSPLQPQMMQMPSYAQQLQQLGFA